MNSNPQLPGLHFPKGDRGWRDLRSLFPDSAYPLTVSVPVPHILRVTDPYPCGPGIRDSVGAGLCCGMLTNHGTWNILPLRPGRDHPPPLGPELSLEALPCCCLSVLLSVCSSMELGSPLVSCSSQKKSSLVASLNPKAPTCQ